MPKIIKIERPNYTNGCALISFSPENQSKKNSDIRSEMRNQIGDSFDNIIGVYHLYGDYDYAIFMNLDGKQSIFKKLRECFEEQCDKEMKFFEDSESLGLHAPGYFRIFSMWWPDSNAVKDGFKRMKSVVSQFQGNNSFRRNGKEVYFDFLACDDEAIIVSMASKDFSAFDNITDVLDQSSSAIYGRKKTLVVSSDGNCGFLGNMRNARETVLNNEPYINKIWVWFSRFLAVGG